jgi:hypothetical protein
MPRWKRRAIQWLTMLTIAYALLVGWAFTVLSQGKLGDDSAGAVADTILAPIACVARALDRNE